MRGQGSGHNMNTKAVLSVGLLLLAGAGLLQWFRRSDGLHKLEGQAAPRFELSDLDGQTVSLAQLRGKIVMLDFWATWCAPCRISMPILDKLQREFSNDMVLLAVNLLEPRDLVREYVARQNVRSRVLLDPEGNVMRQYESESIPMQVIIDQEGIVQLVNIGLSPRMEDQLRGEINRLRNNN